MSRVRMLGLAVLVVVAGCGGGSGSTNESTKRAVTRVVTTPAVSGAAPSPSASPRLTHKRYVKRADAICLAARRRFVPSSHAKPVAAPASGDSGAIFRRYETAAMQTARVDGTILGQVRTLAPPLADQAQVDRLDALLAQLGVTARQISAAAAATDAARVARLSATLATTAGRYQSAADTFGLHVCGQTAAVTLYRRGNR